MLTHWPTAAAVQTATQHVPNHYDNVMHYCNGPAIVVAGRQPSRLRTRPNYGGSRPAESRRQALRTPSRSATAGATTMAAAAASTSPTMSVTRSLADDPAMISSCICFPRSYYDVTAGHCRRDDEKHASFENDVLHQHHRRQFQQQQQVVPARNTSRTASGVVSPDAGVAPVIPYRSTAAAVVDTQRQCQQAPPASRKNRPSNDVVATSYRNYVSCTTGQVPRVGDEFDTVERQLTSAKLTVCEMYRRRTRRDEIFHVKV